MTATPSYSTVPDRTFRAAERWTGHGEGRFLAGKEGGPAWTRTRDLFLIREVRVFLMRPVLSDNLAYLRPFRYPWHSLSPALFGSVPVRLLHGCCTL